MIENLLMGFKVSLSLENIILCFTGCTLGTIIGVLPGLGPTATVAILLTLTYKMNLASAIIMLAGIYYGAQYGGTITSILLRIPGEASTVVTCIDGYQMALKGEAGKALGIAAFGSFIAGTLGTIFLSFLAPLLSNFALIFGPPEYTALMFLGLTLVVYLGSGSVAKSILTGAFGLMLGLIGLDPVTGFTRFTFGSHTLLDGINIAILAMGLFGIGEILFMAGDARARSSRDIIKVPQKLGELLPNRKDWRKSTKAIGRGTIIGFLLGILPGGGVVISTFTSYAVEKKCSKNPEIFGKGAIEGVAGPESANNAATSGSFIPLLTLGIPANTVMALLMGAFMIHGVTPGPFMLNNNPDLFWGIITSMYIGNIILLILNVPLIKIFVKILQVPLSLLSPLIAFVCVIGAYSINNNPIDIIIMVLFGGLGYLMRRFNYEPAPLMLAFILGPILEQALRQSLIMSNGDPLIFFRPPIAMILIAATLFIIISPILMMLFRRFSPSSTLQLAKTQDEK